MKSKISKFFKPKNAGKVIEDKFSPNGKYRLVITAYSTKKDCWSYTQGLIYNADKVEPLFEVQRNYSSFPYSWIEHPNGHEYLVCGADYQGQTVLELDTGNRKDFIPEEAKKGEGFCWVQYRFDAASKVLVVAGCYWACPYEYKFYDFSNPMTGWPEIITENDNVDDDDKWPTFESDGTIKTYITKYDDDDNDDDDDAPAKPEVIKATKIFVREGLKLKLLKEEVSEEERIKREKQVASWKKYDDEVKLFKETDPLYLCHANLVKDSKFSPEDHCGIGHTYDNWCPHFKGKERRFCRRIVKKNKITIDLEWGMVLGPIKLVIYKNGKSAEDMWFEHSVDDMKQAFKAAKDMIK